MKNEDGLDKNTSKFKADIEALKAMPDGRPADWLKKPWDMHHWVDMFVESGRAANYLMGHVWAVYVPVSLVLIVWGWVD